MGALGTQPLHVFAQSGAPTFFRLVGAFPGHSGLVFPLVLPDQRVERRGNRFGICVLKPNDLDQHIGVRALVQHLDDLFEELEILLPCNDNQYLRPVVSHHMDLAANQPAFCAFDQIGHRRAGTDGPFARRPNQAGNRARGPDAGRTGHPGPLHGRLLLLLLFLRLGNDLLELPLDLRWLGILDVENLDFFAQLDGLVDVTDDPDDAVDV